MAAAIDVGDLELQIPNTILFKSDWQKTCILSRMAADQIYGRTTVQDFIQCKRKRSFSHYVESSMGGSDQGWGLLRMSAHPDKPKCRWCNRYESHPGDDYMDDVARIYLSAIESISGGQASRHRADVRRWRPNATQPEISYGPQYPTPPSTSPSSSQVALHPDSLHTPSSSQYPGPFSSPEPEPAPFIDLTLSPQSSSQPQPTRKRKAISRSGSPVPKGKGKQRCINMEDSPVLEGQEAEYIAVTAALTEELIESPGDIGHGLEEVLINLQYQLLTCRRF
ncbi:hypothetical protein AAF712_014798 [Marasmius tenuissimus]|uniref:Uncharacterized protein n=1 Tax=Marasmius tenuissimus TaxID=585030 RepID=A0ABR2ZA15_9AGAR